MKTLLYGTRRPRIWYDADEIERITADALHAAGLWPTPDHSEVDVERLLEVHLQATVDYAGDMDSTTLGYTIFNSPPHVVISKRLTELADSPSVSIGLRGRWRATVAHEAAHILLHAELYARERSNGEAAVHCLRSEIEAPAEARDWREVQANIGMASLLMPRDPFLAVARRILRASPNPVFPPLTTHSVPARSLVDALAKGFGTSRQAALFRLMGFGFVAP